MARRKSEQKSETMAKAQVSPQGVALWAYLDKPAPAQDGMKERFKISLFFEPSDAGFQRLEKILDAAHKKWGATEASCIKQADEYCIEYAKENGIEGISLGQPYISFNTKEGPVPVVGADGKETSQSVWSGDIARVQFNVVGWTFARRKGVSCYLAGVQLLKSNHDGAARLSTSALEAVEQPAEEGEAFVPEDSKSLEELLNS